MMLDRWLRESFEAAPYNTIRSVGSGMKYSHELGEPVEAGSSNSVGYLECEMDAQELVTKDRSTAEKICPETPS